MDRYLSNLNCEKPETDGFSDEDKKHKARIIINLQEDGFISQSQNEITIKGRIFINNGGYVAQHEIAVYNARVIGENLRLSSQIASWTKYATVAAVCLFLVELASLIYEILCKE